MSEYLENNFRRTGLIHIVVLSGFNLTIIAYFVFKLLSGFHRNIKYLISFLFIFIFVIMVGAGATIVRAGIMISVFIFSKLFRRNSDSVNSLLLAGSIMIFLNPMILLHDPSFQLSFVATLGLISFYRYIDKVFLFMPNSFSLREIIVSNISVQLAVIPLLVYMMGEFSVISLIPNILVLPIIPFFMLVSFFGVIFSFAKPFSYILILSTEVLSSAIVYIVNYFGSLNFSVLKIGDINPGFLKMFILTFSIVVVAMSIFESYKIRQKYNYLLS